MTVTDLYRAPASSLSNGDKVINDFSFMIATVNGTGSQTSNNTLLRTLFRMGVPINGKNLFPSNIYGLPTWYYIRLNKDGYFGHKNSAEVVVAYNFDTFARDVDSLPSGGVLLYPMDDPDSRKKKWDVITTSRDDIYVYRIPVDQLLSQVDPPQSLKEYVANMAYVGALAYLFNFDMGDIEAALSYHFKGKAKAIDLNFGLVKLTYDWAQENLEKLDPYWIESMEGTYESDAILIDGNSAAALGATFGGVQVVSWYPITPSSSVAEALQTYLATYRQMEDGKRTYAIIQAEDELAAIGMITGAGWAGARAMTATSGPGISLMAEFAGLAYFAEVPIVIWDVQRVGPSTGLPTRTSQGDILFTHFLGHGDTRQVVLLPSNMEECFQFGWQAFDLAERFQTPVFVLSDLDLGMNQHVSRRFEYPDAGLQRGKVLSAEALEQLNGEWGRYLDRDGDGITYRTLPGTDHPRAAYFTRGTGHDTHANYSERSEDWQANLDRLHHKFETIRGELPQPIIDRVDGAQIGIISYGSNDYAIKEARDRLAAEGIATSYLRILSLPLSYQVQDFASHYDRVYVVENNHDGQMSFILRVDFPELAARFRPVARCNGLPLDADWIVDMIKEKEG
ncbi:MAG: 2-oxoacid:acceptor oxidoreductase subunit alpha [Chloroflexi bacterium]|nr:2-oxoacid:acceptor oxidoreductase subunit alpha [Chloroflexota bacterium]